MDSSDGYNQILHLDADSELQFEIVVPGQEIVLQVLTGSAEIYGSQLHPGDVYRFAYFCSIAVFSSDGCVLKLMSSQKFEYRLRRSEKLPFVKMYNEYLHSFRRFGNYDKQRNTYPITLITGPTDVGKSTLCHHLLNNAARRGRRPLFVDLDVGQSTLSIPGTFSILPVEEQCNAYGRFDESSSAVYFFGYKSPGHSMTLYKRLLDKLGQTINIRLNCGSDNTEYTEVIIDTCGWINNGGYNLILETIQAFDVNTVFAIGSNSHYDKLRYDLPSKIELRNISKLDGVKCRNRTVRINTRDSRLNEYFYGSSKTMKHYRFQVHFSDIEVYKANRHSETSSRNTSAFESDTTLVQIEPCIMNHIFGVSYATDVQNILLTSVYGFVCFVEIDMESETVSILSPQPAPLPSKYLLMGDIVFHPQDQVF